MNYSERAAGQQRTHNMKHNKKALSQAWGMSNKNAAIFARYEKLNGSEWMFSEDRKVSDSATREAAKSLLELGMKEFVKLTKEKAKAAQCEDPLLPDYCPILGSTRGLAEWG